MSNQTTDTNNKENKGKKDGDVVQEFLVLDENIGIEEGIAAFYENQDQEHFASLMSALKERIFNGGELLVSVETPKMVYRKFKMADGDDQAFVGFTTPEQYQPGNGGAALQYKMDNVLRQVLSRDDIIGIVLNPYTDPFVLTKEIINMLLQPEQPEAGKSEVLLETGDITKLDVDCIVNAANHTLLGGGGVDGAIHRAAGPQLLEECKTLGGCQTGEAKITKGYNLKAKYVIHTVGPVYSGADVDAVMLANCYKNALNLAKENDIHSIAFPAISTGVYKYPMDKAASVALQAVGAWASVNGDYPMQIILCCYNDRAADVYKQALRDLMEEV